MTAQHTPGPWMAHCEDPSYASYATDPDMNRVAMMMSLKGPFGVGGRRSEEEVAANARLIAAAPDLLEIARLLSLATDEGDDAAQGTHYVDKQGRIRCKGSFLALIE